MNAVKIFLMTALLTAVTMSAFGQQLPAAGQPGGQYWTARTVGSTGQLGGGAPLSDEQREEIRKRVDTIRIWRLVGALKLDANTSAKLSTFLSAIDQQRRNIHSEQIEMIKSLQLAVKSPKFDESKLKADLDKIEKTQLAMQELVMNEMSGLKNILTIEQQARYVVFQHEFMHEMRGMINNPHSGPGMGGRMGPGGATGIRSGQTRSGMGQGTPAGTPGK